MYGDEFACPSLDGQSAFLRAWSDLAALRVKFAGARVARLLRLDRRYREDQPRVPAGNPDGGQWTDGERVAMAKIIQGAARYLLRNPKVLKPAEKTLEDLLKPGGKELGVQAAKARPGIRTLDKDDFQKLKTEILDGAKEIAPPRGYDGKAYQRPDGTEVGVRQSAEHGETLDVLKSGDETILKNGYKVHKK